MTFISMYYSVEETYLTLYLVRQLSVTVISNFFQHVVKHYKSPQATFPLQDFQMAILHIHTAYGEFQ